MNPLLTRSLSGWAQEMGFESEAERLEMILSVPHYKEDAVLAWMEADSTKAGLLAILSAKRPVGRQEAEE